MKTNGNLTTSTKGPGGRSGSSSGGRGNAGGDCASGDSRVAGRNFEQLELVEGVELLEREEFGVQVAGSFPSALVMTSALDEVLELAGADAGVKDLLNIPFRSIVDNDGRGRRLTAARDRIGIHRLE